MNSVQATESLNAKELQIWNNAAFDDGEEDSSAIEEASSWSNLPPDFINKSFNSDENRTTFSLSSSIQSSVSITDPINLQEKPPPPRALNEASSAKSKSLKVKFEADQIKKRDIDAEIEEVEKEIGRLSTKLESLRLEKAEQTAKSIAMRGRIIPAKFMEPPQKAKIEDSKPTIRRGVSLGPGEILSASKKMTPATNRRKSCFFKLPGIEESKVTKARGRASLSLSPRSRKAATKIKAAAATTVGGLKRASKKDKSVLATIQPKRLFKEDEKNVLSSRKPLKQGRVVASRYSQMTITQQTKEKDSARKRSLPENEEKENHNRSEKRRASDENSKSEVRVKKRWEIPSEGIDLYSSGVENETPVGKELPKIRTLRRVGESPRDSGAAKRVADLEGKDRSRSFAFCQILKFDE